MQAEKTRRRRVHKLFQKTKRGYFILSERKYATLAGALVFFLLMSLVPMLFFAALLFGKSFPLEKLLSLGLIDWAEDLLLYLKTHAEGATAGASVFFLATTLWSGTGFFYHLRRSGELIYDKKGGKGWKIRLYSALLIAAALLYFALLGALLAWVNAALAGLAVWVKRLVLYALLLLFSFFGAWLLNVYVCPEKPRAFSTAAGGAATAAGWLFATLAFSVFLRFTSRERLYGGFSAIIVFLLYLYWLMTIFTAGVILSRELSVRKGEGGRKAKNVEKGRNLQI